MNQLVSTLFLGRLGKNPELKYTKKREPVCYLAVAEQNNNSETPQWRKVIVWGKQAEQCSIYLKKGEKVFVQGRNVEREFTNEKGEVKRYQEIKADLIGFLTL